MPRASLAEVARAAFPRNQWDRVPHALVGGVGRLSEGVLEGRTLGECGLVRVTAGNQRVDLRGESSVPAQDVVVAEAHAPGRLLGLGHVDHPLPMSPI